jgi:hypothetical protein
LLINKETTFAAGNLIARRVNWANRRARRGFAAKAAHSGLAQSTGMDGMYPAREWENGFHR